jgi:PKD repeat protein
MFKINRELIGLCFFLVAFFASAAHAETVSVNPGPVDGNANDFFFEAADEDGFVNIVWTDSKTLEYTSGTRHFFFLYGPDCSSFVGVLLDAAGKPIPETAVGGRTQCTAGSELSTGRIDLPTGTIFSGIRLSSGGFNTVSGWSWAWNPDDRPVVGQTEASGNQPPVADAGGPYVGVAGSAVSFDASGSSDPDGTIFTYTWDFGDDTTLGGETVQHTYASGALYNVTLTVTDDSGTSTSISTIADIGNNSLRPTADAGGAYTGDTITQVSFDGTGSADPDGTVDQYDWDFGDGTPVISGTATPAHLYNTAGTYYVVLTVTDNTGETDTTVTQATITTGNQAPEADAGPPAEGTVGTAVSFDGSGSSDAEGPIAQYAWDFGDGSPVDTVSGANPSHTYAAADDYTVLLTVTDGNSVRDTSETSASIAANPLPPRADAGAPAVGTTGAAVSFDGSGSVDQDGNIVTYAWDFGDGSPVDTVSGANPSHTYAAADTYTVTLTVTDNDSLTGTDTTTASIDQANAPPTSDAGEPYAGFVNLPVIFDGSASSDGDGDIVQYDWDFGDGNSGSGLYTSHTYVATGVYEVTLTVTDDNGGTDESTTTAIVGSDATLPPRVFTNGPYNGVAGVPLTFDGSNTSDPDGTLNTYEWAFGDANSATGITASNNYAAGGLYAVILQATSSDGFTASEGTIARIGNLSLPPSAVANASNEPYKGRVAVPLAFNGGDSNDPDGTINRYDWAFGDGNIANDAGPLTTNTYATPGRYLARLTVTDDSGETDTTFTVVTIGEGNLPPLAFAGDSVSGTVGNAITFDGTGSSDPDGSVASYAWTFGDGNTGTGPNPSHTYTTAGTYFVVMTVTDSDGGVGSDVTLAEVTPTSSSGGGGGSVNISVLGLFALLYLVRRRAG